MRRILTPSIIILLFIQRVYAVDPVSVNFSSPHVFIENKGQVVDQSGRKNDDVKFIYHEGLFNLQLRTDGFSYEIFHVTKNFDGLSEEGWEELKDRSDFLEKLDIDVYSHRVDVWFEGANASVIPKPFNQVETYFNYIFAPVALNQHLHVPAFEKIEYKDLYPGIDLVFYAPGDDGEFTEHLRYEFIVHPGADLSDIRWRYEGATDFSLNGSGDLNLSTSFGFIRETQPLYFIEGKPEAMPAHFLFKKNIRTFSRADYDRSKFLIIDPNIIWGSYYGGETADEIAECVVDSKSKPTIDGNTVSFTHIASSGAYQAEYGGGVYDYFIAKFTASGKMYWSTYFGGSGKDFCYGLGVDQKDNLIAVGNSTSSGMATPGAFKDSVTSDKADILIAKFTPEGSLIWCTYYGGEGPENARNVVADGKGRLYLSGTTGSATGIPYGNAHQSEWGGTDDTWLAKFTKNGWPVWSTYYGGEGVDRAHVVNIDELGNCYVGGTCNSTTQIASENAFQPFFAGLNDAYLAKFDTSGNFIWGTYIGGPFTDRTRGVECDSNGNVYIAGFTDSDTGIASPESFQPEISAPGETGDNQTEDAFLIKFNPDGERQWGTYYGGAGDEELWGTGCDRETGAIFLCGSTNSDSSIAYSIAMQKEKVAGQDGFLAKFIADGTPDWGTYYGGQAGDQFEDAMAGHDNFLYVCARTTAASMPVTSNTYQSSFFGEPSDAMLYKFYVGNDCFDQFEPNEISTSAYLMKGVPHFDSTNYGFNGSIDNSDDQDWYKVKVKSPAVNYRIILQDLPENYSLKLSSSDGTVLYESLTPGLTPDTITANNLSPATYYFQVYHGMNSYDPLRCYHVRIYNSETPFAKESAPVTVSAKDLLVFPNPAGHEVTVRISSAKEEQAGIMIFDMLHRLVYSQDVALQAGLQDLKIPVESLSGGPFQVVIRGEQGTWIGKFIKE